LTEPYFLGVLIDEDDIEAIDFVCNTCGHSFDDHEKVKCSHGVFRKCECKHFVLIEEQVKDAREELMQIEDILFEHYKKARRLNDS